MGPKFEILTVFLSSPSGLDAERKAVRDVLAQLNADLGSTFGLHFSVVGSDSHAVPGVGSDPQDVINQQAIDVSDIYLGIMWHRYGTPTPRSGSGTQEEFDRAMKRHPRPHVLFYFKTTAAPLLDIDPEQLHSVRSFRTRMRDVGALYSDFGNLEELKIHLRTHFTALMVRLGARPRSDSPPPTDATVPRQEISDLGVLDYLDSAWMHVPEFRKSTGRILASLKRLLLDYRRLRTELVGTSVDYGSVEVRQRARLIYDQTAARVTRHVAELEGEIPKFRQSIREGVDAMTRALVVGTEDGVVGAVEQLPLVRALYSVLSDSLSTGSDVFSQVRVVMRDVPRMTESLNTAQHRLTACLSELGDAFEEARRILQEAVSSIDAASGQ